jgi:ABC-type nitrate/sulfonate/bicarbonate transport system permease component
MPNICNSLRLLFGIGFGYIMLAETMRTGGETGGVGFLITTAMSRATEDDRRHIYLILLLIPVVALAIDRALFWVQQEMFPYRYGSAGYLYQLVRGVGYLGETVTGMFLHRIQPPGVGEKKE